MIDILLQHSIMLLYCQTNVSDEINLDITKQGLETSPRNVKSEILDLFRLSWAFKASQSIRCGGERFD